VDTGGAQARLVFQEPRLLPWASVGANVAVGLGRAPTKADEAVVQETLSLVGLGDRGGVWPSTLSGGQRQRVALARALVSHPGFLALDEPFGALDALTRLDMQGLLERVWQGQGFTAVLVTHDVAEAVALGDRVVLIDAGRIALDVPVPVERPRKPGDPRLAAIEAQVLERLFQG
jgi:sulfonate transport system ATP-binding protein